MTRANAAAAHGLAVLAAHGTCTGAAGCDAGADFDDRGCVDPGDLAVLPGNCGT